MQVYIITSSREVNDYFATTGGFSPKAKRKMPVYQMMVCSLLMQRQHHLSVWECLFVRGLLRKFAPIAPRHRAVLSKIARRAMSGGGR